MITSLVILYIIIALLLFFLVDINFDTEFITSPKFFYDKGLNWFGSIVTFILFMLFNPIGFCIRIIYWLFLGIKWLFTVGREDDE